VAGDGGFLGGFEVHLVRDKLKFGFGIHLK
jgi:hypothetical protein